MLRKLLAFVIALTIAITGIVQPAYAASGNTYTFSNQGNGNSVYINDSSQNFNTGANDSFPNSNSGATEHILKTIIDVALGFAVPVAICYGADAAATTVFPPAAALAPFCPNLGASTGGAGVVLRAVAQH